MNPAELFEANLALIERVIGVVCRRSRIYGADAEDFASTTRLALIENDYAILRKYEGRSSLATFLGVVIQRLFFDQQTQTAGRWHASREAERLGEAAVLLELQIHRHHRSLDEALPLLQRIDPLLTRDQVAAMAARLPERAVRPHPVALDGDLSIPAGDLADARVVEGEQRRVSARLSSVVRRTLAALPQEDRMIIRFRFVSGMSIADISRMLRLPQRPLYRRIETLLQRLRGDIAAAGFEARDVTELIGAAAEEMDFGLTDWKEAPVGQSIPIGSGAVEEAQ